MVNYLFVMIVCSYPVNGLIFHIILHQITYNQCDSGEKNVYNTKQHNNNNNSLVDLYP